MSKSTQKDENPKIIKSIYFFVYFNNSFFAKNPSILFKKNKNPIVIQSIRAYPINKLSSIIKLYYLRPDNNEINKIIKEIQENPGKEYYDMKLKIYIDFLHKYSFSFPVNTKFFTNENKYYFYFGVIKEKTYYKDLKCCGPYNPGHLLIIELINDLMYSICNDNIDMQIEFLLCMKFSLKSIFYTYENYFLKLVNLILIKKYYLSGIKEILNDYEIITFNSKATKESREFFNKYIIPIFLEPYSLNETKITKNSDKIAEKLRNDLNFEYNKIFDKLCIKFLYINNEDYLLNIENYENKFNQNYEMKQLFFELYYDTLLELGQFNIDFPFKNYFSDKYKLSLLNKKKDYMKQIKKYSLNDNFILHSDNFILKNGFYFNYNNKELFNPITNEKFINPIFGEFNFIKSISQLHDNNYLILGELSAFILEINNLYQAYKKLYVFENKNFYYIFEAKNLFIVGIFESKVQIFYNNLKEKLLYDYDLISEIDIPNPNAKSNSAINFGDNLFIYTDIVPDNKLRMIFLNLIGTKKNDFDFVKDIKYFNYVRDINCDKIYLYKINAEIICFADVNKFYLISVLPKEIIQIIQLNNSFGGMQYVGYKIMFDFSMEKIYQIYEEDEINGDIEKGIISIDYIKEGV